MPQGVKNLRARGERTVSILESKQPIAATLVNNDLLTKIRTFDSGDLASKRVNPTIANSKQSDLAFGRDTAAYWSKHCCEFKAE